MHLPLGPSSHQTCLSGQCLVFILLEFSIIYAKVISRIQSEEVHLAYRVKKFILTVSLSLVFSSVIDF